MNKTTESQNSPSSTKYELVCGLEIHAELKTKSKMFCGCKNDPFLAPQPNIYTCPVCLGMPGGLPVANRTAIEWTIKVGLALGCKINLFSKFDRKNYFYPDLPKGYQISQYDIPFCYDGVIQTSAGPVRIHRIHLEEDTGKLLHTTVNNKKVTLVDFNRGGVPLLEIVTEPDIRSPEQAKEYGKKLRSLLRHLEVADCDMEQGGMRLEANISMRPSGSQEYPNYKVEVKNINSFRFMEQAIRYEMALHTQQLDNGQTPDQVTKGFNPASQKTYIQRSKEDAAEYRYFPDPDLPPIRFSEAQIEAIRESLPELPDAKLNRFMLDYKLPEASAAQLVAQKDLSIWVETVFQAAQQNKVEPASLANALINKKIKVVLGEDPQSVLSKYQAAHTTDEIDETELQLVITKIFSENPDAVAKYHSGQKQVVGFFIGQIMRELGKKIDPSLVSKLVTEALAVE
jgi:aspartyl-tRNA(Asn)/glutamyl-tRNA(Gln) amidotransferase subunit B